MLHLKKRHLPPCQEKHSDWPRYDRDTSHRCPCEIHASGTLRLDGFVRKGTGDHRWEGARQVADRWEDAGTAQAPEVREVSALTVAAALDQFMTDRQARRVAPATLKKYRQLFISLEAFCRQRGVRFLAELGPDEIRMFRESWTGAAITNAKRLERLKSFFGFAAESEWLPKNPARSIRAPLMHDAPADPISEVEIAKLLEAIERLPAISHVGHARAHCLVLTLRYTGLRISDVVRLGPDRIIGNRLLVRMAKTGNPVMLKLPEFLLARLRALPLYPGERYFASDTSRLGTATGNARRTLRKVSKLASIRSAHPHRFRDSLAIDLLIRGIPIEDVSEILGHRDVKITLKHYANWIPERQQRLDRAIDALG